MSSAIDEVYQLHDLNIELMDTLIVIGTRLIEYADKYEIQINGRGSLASLIGRAQHLLEQIGTPYRRNLVISDEKYHQHDSDDKEPLPFVGLW